MIRVLTFIIIFIAGKVSFGQDTNYIVKWFYEEQYDKIVNELEPLVPEAKKKYGDKDTVIYGNLIYSIAYAYYNLNNYDKALVYYRDAQKVFEKTNGEASIKYFNIIDRIGDIYHETKSLDFQLKFYEIHLKKHKLKFGEDNLRFGNLVWKIAVVYSDLEDYDTSIIYYEQARKIFERNKYNDSIAYADLMGQLADLYFEKSEYEEAWKVAQLSNKIFNNFYNEQLKGYYISNLLVIKIADKLDKDAIKLEKMIENISIYEALNEGNAVIYLEDVLETAELAFDSEAYDLSKKYFEKSRSIFENSKREDIYLKLYIDLMISTSDYYLGAYLESVKELESILKSVSQVGKNKGNYYLKTINHMLASYLRLNAYTEIDNLIKRSKIDSLNSTIL
jgi:tetratricopeptide (TPR) repeat protein